MVGSVVCWLLWSVKAGQLFTDVYLFDVFWNFEQANLTAALLSKSYHELCMIPYHMLICTRSSCIVTPSMVVLILSEHPTVSTNDVAPWCRCATEQVVVVCPATPIQIVTVLGANEAEVKSHKHLG